MIQHKEKIADFTLANREINIFDIHLYSSLSGSNRDTLHCHKDFYELVLFAEGAVWDEYSGERQMISPGNFFIYAPGTTHRYNFMHKPRYYNILFSPDVLELPHVNLLSVPTISKMLPANGCRSEMFYLDGSALVTALNLAMAAHREAVQKKSGWHENMFAFFIQLLIFLSRRTMKKNDIKNNSLPMKINRVINFMELHIEKEHTLGDLAKLVFMSKSSFRQHFKRITGYSPIQYLIRLRLQHALQLLCLKNDIASVALESGFKEVDYFNRMFRKHLGISPAQINLGGSEWEIRLEHFSASLWQ